MSGDVVSDAAMVLTWFVRSYLRGSILIGAFGGYFALLAVSRFVDGKESWELFSIPFLMSLVLGPVVHFGAPWFVRAHVNSGAESIGSMYLVLWIVGLMCGCGLAFLYERFWQPKLTQWRESKTHRTPIGHDQKTDVRTVAEQLPTTPDPYNVMDYYEAGSICLGLDKLGEPVRIPFDTWRANHVQLAGTTGSGKGIEAQMALRQSLAEGEGVVVFDPKSDEWLPHVLREAAEAEGLPYHYIDLRSETPQINLLEFVGRADLYELLVAGFALSEKGTEADHYRLIDRRFASAAADYLSKADAPGFRSSLSHIRGLPNSDKATGFIGKFEELAEVESINGVNVGVDFEEVLEKGGVIYIVGSMRLEPIKRATRMLMVRLVQLCEQRDRMQEQRSVCVFLDELKYHISKPAMEIFGAARDKGLHAIVAHQSLADLRDVPSDLDPDAVVGSVIENTGLKVIYKIQDPDTAEWLARRSGIKQVYEEHRKIGRNVGHAEIIESERTLKQGEAYLIDTNMIQNLPPRVAVFFGDALPQFVGTSAVPTIKHPHAVLIEEAEQAYVEVTSAPFDLEFADE